MVSTSKWSLLESGHTYRFDCSFRSIHFAGLHTFSVELIFKNPVTLKIFTFTVFYEIKFKQSIENHTTHQQLKMLDFG